MSGTSKIVATIACCFMLCVGGPSLAGILEDHPLAYNDGLGPAIGSNAGAWTGTVGFTLPVSEGTLSGRIDYAVFEADVFNSLFSGAGYTPTRGLVYAYQVINTGNLFVSTQIQGASQPIDNVDAFLLEAGDIAPSSSEIVYGNAVWEFHAPSIPSGQSSYGLAYSATNRPTLGVALTINGGASILSFGLPTPGGTPIPEPSSIALATLAGCALLFYRRSR